MGLLYIMPNQKDEFGVEINQQKQLVIHSYGLPAVFWWYLLAGWVVAISLLIATYQPLKKILQSEDPLNFWIGMVTLITLALLPLFFTCFYFYKKTLKKQGKQLVIEHRLFTIPLRKQTIPLEKTDSFTILHHLDSANVARVQDKADMKGFQNRGYFELMAIDQKQQQLLVDHHSRRSDLEKLRQLLGQH